jgi:phospholipase C
VAELHRRTFLQLAGGTAAASVLTPSIARAASIPANRRLGTLNDVEHVVVLMQENRSFDHYFGTMRGVRGYGDPHPVTLRNGKPVWRQPAGAALKDEVLPFRPDLQDLGLKFLQDIDHEWNSQHEAFAGGNHDRWVPAKTVPTAPSQVNATMAHLERGDIPFHYALADAFTVCDAYHCSVLGPTNPNRSYLWTGWAGNDGKGGGPELHTQPTPSFTWRTYPERLQQAGVSWKIYQDMGAGLDKDHLWGWSILAPYTGNFGDNALLHYAQYQTSTPGTPLHDLAFNATDVKSNAPDQDLAFFDQLAADVQADALPQVSWIVPPEAFSEHPNWPANFGAWYVAQVLDALTSNPDVWAKTVLLLTYDENDGFFDHVVPPYPAVGSLNGDSTVATTHELFAGKGAVHGPFGLGIRVPMAVISPWSTGGWVCSEVFDHTSVIQFLEKRFGVTEPHITPWRRAVCGDLTSAFDFSKTPAPPPTLPSTAAFVPPDRSRHPSVIPDPPAQQRVPRQEPGTRPSRPLGYRLRVDLAVTHDTLRFDLTNHGSRGAHLQARSNDVKGAPFSYTLGAGKGLQPVLAATGPYDVSFHGPNGFFRRFAGNTREPLLEVRGRRRDEMLVLTLHNRSDKALRVHIADAYGADRTVRVRKGGRREVKIGLAATHRWYDVLVTLPSQPRFKRGLAGRFENGRPSTSDPQLGG